MISYLCMTSTGEDNNLFVNKVLPSDLRQAILTMNELLGASFAELLLQQLQAYKILVDNNNSEGYSFDEINSALTAIFGEATPLLMSQLEKHLHMEKN
jgi:hypothetical protein